jgi:hypothetical protein
MVSKHTASHSSNPRVSNKIKRQQGAKKIEVSMAKKWQKGDPLLNMPLREFLEPKGDGYALLIGIRDYHFTRKVLTAVNDVKMAKEEMLLASGWKSKNIKVLLNEKATKNSVLRGIRWLVADRYPNDSLFFLFSGHGTWSRTVKGWECCMCCTDFEQYGPTARGVVAATEWQTEISQKHPDTVLVAIFDSCFSGGMWKPPRKRLPAKLPADVRELLCMR